MGQAAPDLPDPMQAPQVSAASTDDLLAQLAGEEIERLMSEADGTSRPVEPTAAALSESPQQMKAEAVDSLLEPPAPPEPPQPTAKSNQPTADFNSVLTEL